MRNPPPNYVPGILAELGLSRRSVLAKAVAVTRQSPYDWEKRRRYPNHIVKLLEAWLIIKRAGLPLPFEIETITEAKFSDG